MKSVTLLIPAYNEEEVLPHLYERIGKLANDNKHYVWEFMFVIDGSHDRTLDIIKDFSKTDHRVSYLNLSRNFGKEISMIAGIDRIESDAMVIIDADLQDPPELIPEMLDWWEKGYDDVYARRKSRNGESLVKKKTSEWFYKILQRSTHVPIQVDTGDFRLLDRRCILALREFRESQRYTKGLFSWIGYNKKEILYDRDPRFAGVTKWNYGKLLNLAIDGITGFTTAPLRIASVLGFAVSLFAFGYLIYLVVRTWFFGTDLAGYPSMMAVILFLGGVQLISLGIIGEYIGRIFTETKRRPLYFVEEFHSADHKK